MKRRTFLVALGIAVFAGACSSGGTPSSAPPPTGGFTTANLKGNYAFSMAGEDLNEQFLTRAGSFIADGSGNITSGLEDVNDGGQGATVSLPAGTYTMQANGKGTILFGTVQNPVLAFNFVMNSPAPNGGGLLIQGDLNATSSGSFSQQNISSFSQPLAAANYVFDVSGTDAQGFSLSIVGEVATNGSTTIGTTGNEDINDGGTTSGSLPITTSGGVVPDNTNGNNANFGRTTISFGGRSFALYPIDQTHAKVIEIDSSGFASGDFFEQTGSVPTSIANFNSSFVFLVGGSNQLVGGAVTRAGRFTADGGGNLTNIALDQNAQQQDGTSKQFCADSTPGSGCSVTSTGTYNITGPAGRGTSHFVLSGNTATIDDVFYIASPSLGVIQDLSANIIGDGSILGQTSTFAPIGNFAVNITGQAAPSNGNIGFEEDFVGQLAIASGTSNNITGSTDFVELGSTSKAGQPFVNAATTGTLNGAGTGRNGLQLIIGPSHRNFTAYAGGSPPQLLLIGTDSADIDTGTVLTQTTPQ